MDNEITWIPQNVADLASKLSQIGNSYRKCIAEVYNAFNSIGLNDSWNGKNYNTIASNVLNKSKETFEEWANFLQYKIPEILYIIASTQAATGGGNVYFQLYDITDEIKEIEYTPEKADGSFILKIGNVNRVLDGEIEVYIANANKKLQEYYSQFEELGTLDNNRAVLEIYERLDLIISKNKTLLSTFSDEIRYSIKCSIENTQITEQETLELASKVTAILDDFS